MSDKKKIRSLLR